MTVALVAAMMASLGCSSGLKPVAQADAKSAPLGWRSVGSWSGRGDAQTDSFEIAFDQCRIRWEARNETSPGAGRLRITVNSAVSGRELALAVDRGGVGKGVVYPSVEPHFSYLLIESSNLDWSVTVEEPELRDGQGTR